MASLSIHKFDFCVYSWPWTFTIFYAWPWFLYLFLEFTSSLSLTCMFSISFHLGFHLYIYLTLFFIPVPVLDSHFHSNLFPAIILTLFHPCPCPWFPYSFNLVSSYNPDLVFHPCPCPWFSFSFQLVSRYNPDLFFIPVPILDSHSQSNWFPGIILTLFFILSLSLIFILIQIGFQV